jgi:hypothetical protein
LGLLLNEYYNYNEVEQLCPHYVSLSNKEIDMDKNEIDFKLGDHWGLCSIQRMFMG